MRLFWEKAFAGNCNFHGTANLGYLEAIKCHFWGELNSIWFFTPSNQAGKCWSYLIFAFCILSYAFTEITELSAILRTEIEKVDPFWVESNPNSFFCPLQFTLRFHRTLINWLYKSIWHLYRNLRHLPIHATELSC